ncbi:hypothetical protein Tco_0464788 [Tanacetum coccineum]
MTMDDLLQVVPQLMSRIDSLETDLKQTKLTMGSAIVKLVKKVKKLEGILKRRNVVLSDSEEEGNLRSWGGKSQVDSSSFLCTGSTKRFIPSPDKGQREGKAPMIIEEAPKKSKEQILQEEASLAEAIRLDTLQKEEEAKQGTWKLSQLKNLSFEEVKDEFDKMVKQVESFAPINLEATKDSLKRFGTKIPVHSCCIVAYEITSIATITINQARRKRDDLTELYRIVMNRYGLMDKRSELEKSTWTCTFLVAKGLTTPGSDWPTLLKIRACAVCTFLLRYPRATVAYIIHWGGHSIPEAILGDLDSSSGSWLSSSPLLSHSAIQSGCSLEALLTQPAASESEPRVPKVVSE